MKRARCRKPAGSRARTAGFTLVEVMIAVSVLIVGATGYTLLQGASGRAIQGAQEHTVALQVQETWVERIRRDATTWTQPGFDGLASTQYLAQYSGNKNSWFTPAEQHEGSSGVLLSPSADFAGRDVTAGPAARYCVNLRMQPAHYWNPLTNVPVPATDLDMLRVDIRVWWSRLNAGQGTVRTHLNDQGGLSCSDKLTRDDLMHPSLMKTVTFTMVRWQ